MNEKKKLKVIAKYAEALQDELDAIDGQDSQSLEGAKLYVNGECVETVGDEIFDSIECECEFSEDEMIGYIMRTCAENGVHLPYIDIKTILDAEADYFEEECSL